MAFLTASLLALTLQALPQKAGSVGPEYPLGPLRLPPIAEPASPFRLVDLRYAFTEGGGTVSSFETRVRVGARAFVGGEVTGDRHGLFFDTQRLELGITEENGAYEIESSFRAPRFLLAARARRPSDERHEWSMATDGSIRFSNDLELLLSYFHDFDDRRFTPGTVEEFAATGVLPPNGPPTRELRAGSAGLFYQRGNALELLAEVRRSRVRTEASFDLDVSRYRLRGLWNQTFLELDGELAYQETSGRLRSREALVSFGAQVEVGKHFLAHGATLGRWEPGILLFDERYEVGLTFFGREHRYARGHEAAARVLDLVKRVNALGYNERRVYDVDGLRRLRERLGISPDREELADALDELYRAEVRERNVPQLGFTVELTKNAILGVKGRAYGAFLGVPWRLRWPFTTSDDVVEFVTLDFVLHQDEYPDSRVLSRELSLRVFLNREMSLAFRWEQPGLTPEERAARAHRSSRFLVSYEYALGR